MSLRADKCFSNKNSDSYYHRRNTNKPDKCYQGKERIPQRVRENNSRACDSSVSFSYRYENLYSVGSNYNNSQYNQSTENKFVTNLFGVGSDSIRGMPISGKGNIPPYLR